MRKFSRSLLAACFFAGTFLCQSVPAQPPVVSANRILFVVQTSWAMRQRLPAVKNCVQELIGSGLHGQLRAGDTIGLWTYDNELHAGVLPMQMWADDQRTNILQTVGDYLGQQKPKGKARLDLVLPEILRVVRESEAITVLLISDGQEVIKGTPFDESINEVFQQHRKELQAAHVPFVTVLVARVGRIVNCNVSSATAVNVPALLLPGETKPVPSRMEKPSLPPAPAPLPVKTNPPLIVDYSKSNLIATANHTNDKTTVSNLTAKVLPPPPAIETSAPPATPVAGTIESVTPPPLTMTASVPVAPKSNATSPPSPESNGEIFVTPPTLLPATSSAKEPPSKAKPSAPASLPVFAIIVAGSAVLLVAGLGWLLARRHASSRTGGSLITKSFDQGKGK